MPTSPPTKAHRNQRTARRSKLRELGDSELLTLLNRGDRKALETLYERHYRDALRYAQRLSYRTAGQAAEDIVSEAIRRVLSAIDGGRGPVIGFREYLFTAVRSVSMTSTRNTHTEEPADSLLDDITPAADDDLDGLVMMQAFRSLPARWQGALWAAIVTEMKPVELAPTLGLSANGVAALLKRARDALRVAYVRTHLPSPADLACRRTLEYLARSVARPIAPNQQLRMDDHLERCVACRDAAATIGDEIAAWTRWTLRANADMPFSRERPGGTDRTPTPTMTRRRGGPAHALPVRQRAG